MGFNVKCSLTHFNVAISCSETTAVMLDRLFANLLVGVILLAATVVH